MNIDEEFPVLQFDCKEEASALFQLVVVFFQENSGYESDEWKSSSWGEEREKAETHDKRSVYCQFVSLTILSIFSTLKRHVITRAS